MRKYLLAAAAAAAVATPAAARDNSFYAGVDAGALFAKDRNLHIDSKNSYYFGYYLNLYTGSYTADVRTDYKTGYDVDAVAGYDFGIFRLEGELGYKHASHDHYAPVGTLADAVGDVEVPADGKTTVLSGMINGLLDFGINDGLSFSVGGGAGIAKTKYRFAFPATDTFFDNLRTSVKGTKFAWQVIAAARYAISPNIDVGLKYRYFDGGHIHDLIPDSQAFPDPTPPPTAGPTNRGDVDLGTRLRSHSLLASLIFNFGSAAPPPPPAPPTCPDGSVILATSTCPPPPAPPPPPPTERGERG